MAQNSFVLKGWSVTLVTAMMALAVSDKTEVTRRWHYFQP